MLAVIEKYRSSQTQKQILPSSCRGQCVHLQELRRPELGSGSDPGWGTAVWPQVCDLLSRCPFRSPGCAVCSHSLRTHLSTPPLFSAASGHLPLLTIQSLPCPVHGRTGPQRRPPPFAAATFQPISLPLRRRPLPACSAQSDSAWLSAIQWTCSLWVRS